MNQAACLACGAVRPIFAVKRCWRCYDTLRRTTPPQTCGTCGRVTMVWPETGVCAQCGRIRDLRARRYRRCVDCGELRRIAARDLCTRCWQRDPDRPFRYADRLAQRLPQSPSWLGDFTAFTSARFGPHRALDILRDLSRLLDQTEEPSPRALLARIESGALQRTLEAFFVERHLTLPGDQAARRAHDRRAHRVLATPEPFRPAVASWAAALVERQQRARRLGLRADTDRTIEIRLATIRDFARFCTSPQPPLAGWEQVSRSEVESFLSSPARQDAKRLVILRSFFRWARRRRLVLTDPTHGLWRNCNGRFSGDTLTLADQQRLFRRWADGSDCHPHEAFVGLAALLHGATQQELRALTIDDIDQPRRTVRLGRRPHPLLLDPYTWAALDRCLTRRAELRTLNSHLLVTRTSATGSAPASPAHLVRVLSPGGASLRRLRSTRLCRMVGEHDPLTVAIAFGLTPKATLYYRGDTIDQEHAAHLNDLLVEEGEGAQRT